MGGVGPPGPAVRGELVAGAGPVDPAQDGVRGAGVPRGVLTVPLEGAPRRYRLAAIGGDEEVGVGIKLAAGVLAALVAGTALGAVARGLMTLVALAAGDVASFSWGGTSFILLLFVLVMVPGAVVAGFSTHRARWLLPAAGAVFLCVPAVGVAGAEIGGAAGVRAAPVLRVGGRTPAPLRASAPLPLGA